MTKYIHWNNYKNHIDEIKDDILCLEDFKETMNDLIENLKEQIKNDYKLETLLNSEYDNLFEMLEQKIIEKNRYGKIDYKDTFLDYLLEPSNYFSKSHNIKNQILKTFENELDTLYKVKFEKFRIITHKYYLCLSHCLNYHFGGSFFHFEDLTHSKIDVCLGNLKYLINVYNNLDKIELMKIVVDGSIIMDIPKSIVC